MIDQNKVAQFHQEGYLLLEEFFDSSFINTVNSALEKLLAENELSKIAELEPEANTVARRIWSPTERIEDFYDMAIDEKLLNVLECLIGPNIVLQYSKLNMKGPQIGSLVDWHQDFSYYPHTNTNLLVCLVYLEDADEENGCLEVVPRTEYTGLLDHYVDGFFRGKIAAQTFSQDKKVTLTAPAGSVIILHCLTAHYSRTNTSSRSRRTFIPAYRAADAFPIYHGPHAAHNEAKAKIVRGKHSNIARVEEMNIMLPFSEKKFGSLYEIQAAEHLNNDANKIDKGYFIETV